MSKKEEKEIEYLFAHVNRLWAGIMILGGGLAGLFITFSFTFTFSNIAKFLLLSWGIFIFILMLIGLANTSLEIKKKIKEDIL